VWEVIDETGRAIEARVVASEVVERLAEAARRAALDWLFIPARRRHRAVKVGIVIPFEFVLRRAPRPADAETPGAP
jgi:TonB family protein